MDEARDEKKKARNFVKSESQSVAAKDSLALLTVMQDRKKNNVPILGVAV